MRKLIVPAYVVTFVQMKKDLIIRNTSIKKKYDIDQIVVVCKINRYSLNLFPDTKVCFKSCTTIVYE